MSEAVGVAEVPPCGRLVLLITSPRVAPGLLSWPAWQHLRQADVVYGLDLDETWSAVLGEAGVSVIDAGADPVGLRAGRLVEATDGGRLVVWLGSPDGDPGLTDALAEHLSRRAVAAEPPEVELLGGSHDLPGSRLLDLVAVMDRLRSPGGCPWDAEQSHTSLAPYLLEESYEVLEAIETGSREDLIEELGDLLLQVVFHARLAQDDEQAHFDIDDVAGGIIEKLVRRHPHVFAGLEVEGADEVVRNWEQIKAVEKGRTGAFEGIPVALPALARAQKMLDRAPTAPRDLTVIAADDEVVVALVAAVQLARVQGRDAETELRTALTMLARSHPQQ